MTEIGLETWRGAVRPHHIDEMGHMNVRFYAAIAMEALVGLVGALGLKRAFSSDNGSTVLVREHHIRFLREARLGDPLHMRCALLELGETDARALQVLYHSLSGEPAAAVTARIEHVAPGELRPFAWPSSARHLAEGLMASAPDFALPRGISDAPIQSRASLAAAEALGLLPTGAGALTPLECDARGRMRPDHLLERVTNGLRHLRRPLQPSPGQGLAKPTLGGATVEFRALYHRWPRAGDCLAVRSGLADLGPKSRRLVHWLLDPFSGQAWASAEMIVLFFDLETRKSTEPPPELAQALERLVIPNLTL